MPEHDRPESSTAPTFGDLPLRDEVQQGVQIAGYERPTPIQSQVIPHVLGGRDLLAQSQTGTGKTAAFSLPILSRIDVHQGRPQALVLVPTRELAIQVANAFSAYASRLPGFGVAAIYGGQDYEPQFRQLKRGVPVVVGTPGRVIDHVKRGTLDLSTINCLVLDEADEMLNMGFLEDVQFVLDRLPERRQVALFSATLPGPIRDIAKQHLNNPVKISIETKTVTTASLRQRALFVSPREKTAVLLRMLEVEKTDGVIVFTKTKESTLSVAEHLSREGLAATALNGDMPQKVRERTIAQLKNGKLDVLVATDVAARGLDVARISHVFNFDLPHDSESYVHRVGRTGRAGRDGEAVLFLTHAQRGKLRLIEKTTKQSIEVVQPPSTEEVNAKRIERFQKRITDVTAENDLTILKSLIEQYAEQSGKPLEMIAAALAHLSQQGRPFLAQDLPAGKPRPRNERNGRNERRDDRGGAEGRTPQRRHDIRLGPPEPGMHRFRLEVGHHDGVQPGNIVGAVANEAGIDSQFIGPIKIHGSYSTIDLPEGMPPDIFHTLKRARVAGKPLRISLASDAGDHAPSGPRHGGPGRKARPTKQKHRKSATNGKRSAGAKGTAGKPGHKRKAKALAKPVS